MAIHIRRIHVIIATILFSSAVEVAFAGDWPMYQHDPAQTGYSDVSFNPQNLTFSWKSPAGYSTPVIAGGVAYSDGQNVVSEFDLATGRILWSTPVVGVGNVAVGGGMLVTTSYPSTINTPKTLEVLNPATGAVLYTMPFGQNGSSPGNVSLYQDSSGQWNALDNSQESSGSNLYSIHLGPSSASLNWKVLTPDAGGAAATIAGNSAIVAAQGGAVAIDLTTGQKNTFKPPGGNGSGNGVAYDASRHEMYFEDYEDISDPVLVAYSYTDNSHITQLWSRPSGFFNAPAIGPNGDVYICDSTTLDEIDPATGATLRSLGGQSFSSGNAPEISNGYLFDFSTTAQEIYDLSTFQLVKTIPGSKGYNGSAFTSANALSDGGFATQNDAFSTSSTFSFYAVPEPSSVALGIGVAILAIGRRPKRDGASAA